ncbi:hypothetical protein DA69_14110 [Brevundimonas naejangsanensis]|uniref:Uncharacterized protein n=1 Tax=Brevundimonas naejangsanensis TaxID=588932 RepID=A0A172Y972_9CAUL|nr:hypothetical protein [Brevundimonas naejangsanensis]ANF55764.1 hypothetical protein DA69_14110 [Brevundimonas naejangsanensis]
MSGFWSRAGVQPGERQALMPAYTDYIDSDDLRQPNGAERADYADGGPANRRLIRPTDGCRSWARVRRSSEEVARPARRAGCRRHLRHPECEHRRPGRPGGLVRLNDSQIETLMRVRAERPLTSLYDVASVTGAVLDLDQEQIFTYPSGATILTLHDTRSAWVYRARLTLTPFGLEQPLWIDQTELTEAPKRARADTTDAIRLPYAPR